MNKIIQNLPLISILITFVYSLTHLTTINQITATTFQTVIHLFYALYPLMVLFSMMNSLDAFRLIMKPLHFPLSKILHLNDEEASIYLASIFSGYPTFAKLIKDSYQCHKITKQSANHLLKIASHGSIGFIVITLGTVLFQKIYMGWLLFGIQVLSNFMIALLFRNREIPQSSPYHHHRPNFITTLQTQFKSCAIIFIYIFGFMLVFNILSQMLGKNMLIHLFLEFSQGCLNLEHLNLQLKFILCSMGISFSSLSVIFQVISVLDGLDLDLKGYIFARILQALVSGLLAYVTLLLIK